MNVMRALIIGPHPGDRRSIARLLANAGFESVEVNNGISALRFATSGAIDLIVTEIDLIGLDVARLLHIVRHGAFGESAPPVIVCSALLHGAAWTANAGLEGATLLPSPFTPDAFATALDTAFPAA